MFRLVVSVQLMAALAMVMVGCSEDPAVPLPGGGTEAQVDLDPSGSGFEIELEFAAGPDDLLRGPFLLKGSPPIWVAPYHGLGVEFTITNIGDESHLVPVTLEFLRFIPEEVGLPLPFDVEGKYLFDFADGDGLWEPDEESLPKWIIFQTDPGRSVAFTAQIGLGGQYNSWVRGQTWKDLDRDGVRGDGEWGLAYCTLSLEGGASGVPAREVLTNTQGEYEFLDVPPGTYELLVVEAPSGYESTTGLSMHVLVVSPWGPDDGVSDADFGFAPVDPLD